MLEIFFEQDESEVLGFEIYNSVMVSRVKMFDFRSDSSRIFLSSQKNVWHNWQPPYKGTTKIERRVEANLNLVENFVSMGVPRKQIIITGHSCGGWTTLMLTSQYMDKVGGGIALNAACYWTLSKKFKVAKIGEEAALEKFAKKSKKIQK